eukprot:12764839-Alexandrium_andersonii.AAC.1
MIRDFRRRCPSRQQGKKRDQYSWVRFIEATATRTVLRRGFEMEMMDRFEYASFMMTKKKMTEEQADQSWSDALKSTPADMKDRKGPAGFEDRVAVLVKDFIVGEQVSEYARMLERAGKWH